jgi:hypothetical protein
MTAAAYRWAFEIVQEGGLMNGMNIFTVLVTVWLPLINMAKGRVALKIMSGYGGVKLAKCLTDKELRDFVVFKQ